MVSFGPLRASECVARSRAGDGNPIPIAALNLSANRPWVPHIPNFQWSRVGSPAKKSLEGRSGLKSPCENSISEPDSSELDFSASQFGQYMDRVFPESRLLTLCIRARLQSGHKGPTKIRALAPGLFRPKILSGQVNSGRIRELA
jgi:hypothetical protein